MAASAFCFGTGSPLASGAAPVGTETKPPAEMTRSQVLRSTLRSFSTGNARAPRLTHELRAVSAVTSVELASHRSLDAGPGRDAVDHHAARAADPLPGVALEGDGAWPSDASCSFRGIEQLEQEQLRREASTLIAGECALRSSSLLPPDVQDAGRSWLRLPVRESFGSERGLERALGTREGLRYWAVRLGCLGVLHESRLVDARHFGRATS
jgi:hypothetical protein